MICILLVAGHASTLEAELKQNPQYAHLEGVPKALLPGVGGKRILDYWWEIIRSRQLFSEVFLVTNADKYKHFERWATASQFPVENIVNDGTTTRDSRLGAVADLDLCLRIKKIREDAVVIAADMMCYDDKFDISHLLTYYRSTENTDIAVYYELLDAERVDSRGIVEVCTGSSRVTRFLEKPDPSQTQSRLASVVFYCLRQETLALVPSYLESHPSQQEGSLGLFMQWLINTRGHTVHGMKLPTGFQLIGETTLADYEKWLNFFSVQSKTSPVKITKRAYARVGLMGNPSDGFNGKTISLSIKNFWAEVSISASSRLQLIPHPLNDPTEFGSLADLHGISSKEGYLGGLRLLQATCKMFYNYCATKGIALVNRNFTLKYDTNIPRQVGLAGSSAIVTATLKCLMAFFNLTDSDIPPPVQPQLILDVEVGELKINAGLQDRVVQVYEGLVYMDFSKQIMDEKGHGDYRKLTGLPDLPPLFLAYLGDPSDSGRIHSDVRQRWDGGEKEVVEGMTFLGSLADSAMEAITAGDWQALADCMNQNFDARLAMYGAEALGETNMKMVAIARRWGAGVKFPGSGGAVLGTLADPVQYRNMEREFQETGHVVTRVIPNY